MVLLAPPVTPILPAHGAKNGHVQVAQESGDRTMPKESTKYLYDGSGRLLGWIDESGRGYSGSGEYVGSFHNDQTYDDKGGLVPSNGNLLPFLINK